MSDHLPLSDPHCWRATVARRGPLPLPGPDDDQMQSAPTAELWQALETARLVVGTPLSWPALDAHCAALSQTLAERLNHVSATFWYSLWQAVETGAPDDFRLARAIFETLDPNTREFFAESLSCSLCRVTDSDIRSMVVGADNPWVAQASNRKPASTDASAGEAWNPETEAGKARASQVRAELESARLLGPPFPVSPYPGLSDEARSALRQASAEVSVWTFDSAGTTGFYPSAHWRARLLDLGVEPFKIALE